MVKLLYSMFNRQIDKQTASSLSLGDLIETTTNPILVNNQEAILSGAQSFLKLWSGLNKSISVRLSSRIVSKFKHRGDEWSNVSLSALDRAKSIPLSYLIPASYGDGIYLYALIFYLIDTHNEFLGSHRAGPKSTVYLDTLTENDCICVRPKKDLINMIYLNSNYTLEHVRELNLEFNYVKIQENVQAKFLAGKKLIDSTVSIYHLNLGQKSSTF